MLRITALLATAAMCVASSASAVEIFLVGESASGSATVRPGDQLVIELRMTNTSGSSIVALGLSAHGYAPGLAFVSGRAVRRYLNDGEGNYLFSVAGTSSGGTGDARQRVLNESSVGTFGPRVQFAASLTQPGLEQLGVDPSLDPGLEGGSTAMFRLVFQALIPGAFTILLDESYQGDGIFRAGVIPIAMSGTSFQVCVCEDGLPPTPEPSTALLIGLGLAGLSCRQRVVARQ